MNLSTLVRHGVFRDAEMVTIVAKKLRGSEFVRRARMFPFQLLAAFKAAKSDVPTEITMAPQRAMQIANVPTIPTRIYLCPDVSGEKELHSRSGFEDPATFKLT